MTSSTPDPYRAAADALCDLSAGVLRQHIQRIERLQAELAAMSRRTAEAECRAYDSGKPDDQREADNLARDYCDVHIELRQAQARLEKPAGAA